MEIRKKLVDLRLFRSTALGILLPGIALLVVMLVVYSRRWSPSSIFRNVNSFEVCWFPGMRELALMSAGVIGRTITRELIRDLLMVAGFAGAAVAFTAVVRGITASILARVLGSPDVMPILVALDKRRHSKSEVIAALTMFSAAYGLVLMLSRNAEDLAALTLHVGAGIVGAGLVVAIVLEVRRGLVSLITASRPPLRTFVRLLTYRCGEALVAVAFFLFLLYGAGAFIQYALLPSYQDMVRDLQETANSYDIAAEEVTQTLAREYSPITSSVFHRVAAHFQRKLEIARSFVTAIEHFRGLAVFLLVMSLIAYLVVPIAYFTETRPVSWLVLSLLAAVATYLLVEMGPMSKALDLQEYSKYRAPVILLGSFATAFTLQFVLWPGLKWT